MYDLLVVAVIYAFYSDFFLQNYELFQTHVYSQKAFFMIGTSICVLIYKIIQTELPAQNDALTIWQCLTLVVLLWFSQTILIILWASHS